jgi:heme exporter protein B
MQKMYSNLHRINLVLKKELLTEFRTRYAIGTLAMFALITLASVSMAIGSMVLSAKLLAILLWIILFFSAMAGMSRVFIQEQETGTIHTLKIYGHAQIILFGKLIYNILLLNSLAIALLPLFVILLNVDIASLGYLMIILLLGNTGMATISTLTAALVVNTQSKGSLFTVLTFPILLPLFLIVIQLTEMAIERSVFIGGNQLLFVGAYDMILIGVSSILFDYIWYD